MNTIYLNTLSLLLIILITGINIHQLKAHTGKITTTSIILSASIVPVGLYQSVVHPFAAILLLELIVLQSLIDFETKYLIDLYFYLFVVLVSVYFYFSGIDYMVHLQGAVLSGLIYGIIFFGAKKFYGREAFGAGDVLFAITLGYYFGIRYVLLVTLLPFYVAIAFIIPLYFTKGIKALDEIPFGPFIGASAILVFFFGNQMINWYFQLMF